MAKYTEATRPQLHKEPLAAVGLWFSFQLTLPEGLAGALVVGHSAFQKESTKNYQLTPPPFTIWRMKSLFSTLGELPRYIGNSLKKIVTVIDFENLKGSKRSFKPVSLDLSCMCTRAV